MDRGTFPGMGKSRGDAMDADPREGMSMEKKEAIWILENGAWWDRKKKEAAREGCFLFAWVVTFH